MALACTRPSIAQAGQVRVAPARPNWRLLPTRSVVNSAMPHAVCTVHVKKGLDSVIRRVESRAAELVGMQSHNVEGLQIVSYTDGQKFETHHDIGPIDDACEHVVTVVPPRRIITLFVYLNDLPQGIGTTNFPLLKMQQQQSRSEDNQSRCAAAGTPDCLKVYPKRGRALLFCNVLVDDPSEPGAYACGVCYLLRIVIVRVGALTCHR